MNTFKENKKQRRLDYEVYAAGNFKAPKETWAMRSHAHMFL